MENVITIMFGFSMLVVVLGIIPPLLGYVVYKLSSAFVFLKMLYDYEKINKSQNKLGYFYIMGFVSFLYIYAASLAIFLILGVSWEIGRAILS